MIKNKKIALYVRVSTGHQIDKDSLPFQKQELTSYCRYVLHVDMSCVEIYEDAGRSGKNTKRPGFSRMMQDVEADRISHVVVYKIDRISRNLVDFSLMYDSFKYHHVTFISLNEQFDTSSAIGEAILKIILVFAELERKLTSERVKDIMINRATEGKWNGARVPFGWDWDSVNMQPVHSEKEAPLVRAIYDMYEQTHSTCKVCAYNNTHNIPTKRGGEWTTKTVADLIRNPLNKGDYRYNYRESARGRKKDESEVIYVKGAFPPLVPVEQWNRCNAIMDKNTEQRNKPGSSRNGLYTHIFSGFLICGSCGSHFQAMKKDEARANGFRPSMYRCGKRYRKRTCSAPGCGDVTLGPFIFNYISLLIRATNMRSKIQSVEELETLLLSAPEFKDVIGIASKGLNDTFNMLKGITDNVLYQPEQVNAKDTDNEQENLKQEIKRIERALERLKNAFLFDDSVMSEKEYSETKNELEIKLIGVENKLKDLNDTAFQNTEELSFVKSAASFFLTHKLQAGEHIIYSQLAPLTGDVVLKDFISLIIERIVVSDRKITEITFKNGLTHIFLYRT